MNFKDVTYIYFYLENIWDKYKADMLILDKEQ